MLTTAQLRQAWGPPCKLTPARVVLYGGAPITVDYRTKEAFEALSRCLEAHSYPADRTQTGAYNCRPITGGTNYSLHAFGIAADINWLRNPYGSRLVTDMPPAMVADIEAIVTVDGVRVFRWGGNYSGNKDAMHYEVVCSPALLARGIAGHNPNPVRPDNIPTASGVKNMPTQETHSFDGRLEKFRITDGVSPGQGIAGQLQCRWQTTAGGPLGPWSPLTPGQTWLVGSLSSCVGKDGNINLGFSIAGPTGVEYQMWYGEPGTASPGWHGPATA